MALSTTQTTFIERVTRDEVEPIYLLQVLLHRSINGMEGDYTLQVSSRPFQSLPTDTPAFDEWIGELQQSGPIQRSVSDGLIFRGESTIGGASFGTIILVNDDQELDTILGPYRQMGTMTSGGYSPRNQTITQYMVGGLPYAERVPIASMVGGDAQLTDTQCSITVQSALRFLDRTMATQVLTRDDFPLIPAATEDAPAPEAWGVVYNVEPKLVDPQESLYYLARRGQQILEVRSNGIPLESFQWQEQNEGRGFLLKMLTGVPSGTKITVDFEGSLLQNGLSSRRVGDIAEDIVLREVPEAIIDSDGIAFLKASRRYDVGIYIKSPTTIREVLIKLFRGLLVWVIESSFGQILFGALELPANDENKAQGTIRDDAGLSDPNAFQHTNIPPVRGVELHYRQLETLQDATSLAGLFTSDPDTYADLIEYYKLGYQSLPFSENAAEIALDPSMVRGPYETRLINKDHARAMKNKYLTLFGETRSFIRLPIDQIGYTFQINDVLFLRRNRMNLESGKGYRILGRIDTETTVTMELWG